MAFGMYGVAQAASSMNATSAGMHFTDHLAGWPAAILWSPGRGAGPDFGVPGVGVEVEAATRCASARRSVRSPAISTFDDQNMSTPRVKLWQPPKFIVAACQPNMWACEGSTA